jgi:hypothetical protein
VEACNIRFCLQWKFIANFECDEGAVHTLSTKSVMEGKLERESNYVGGGGGGGEWVDGGGGGGGEWTVVEKRS